jgi:hypothetical protein
VGGGDDRELAQGRRGRDEDVEAGGPRWMEMAQEVQKQMLDPGNPPTDLLDFYTRWYNATSGPLSKLADDVLRDEAYLDFSRRLLDYYTVFDTVFRRLSEQYVSNLDLPTSSDVYRVAELVVALDDKVDRTEEASEDLEDRLGRIEERLDVLDRVESKLDQLLADRDADREETTADGGR